MGELVGMADESSAEMLVGYPVGFDESVLGTLEGSKDGEKDGCPVGKLLSSSKTIPFTRRLLDRAWAWG